MGIRLKTPAGAVVTVSEKNAARLLKQGFTNVEPRPAPKKRGRPRKTETPEVS